MLWRQRAFEEQSKTILFKVDPNLLSAISAPGLKAHLSLTHSGAFSTFCWSYLRELQQRKFPDQRDQQLVRCIADAETGSLVQKSRMTDSQIACN